MKPSDVFDYFGGAKKASDAIGVKMPSLYTWLEMGRVPWDRQVQIDGITKGKLPHDPESIPAYMRKHIRVRARGAA